MKVDTYLTEFAAELRLGLDDERAAEIVAEIAAHLQATGNNPIDEFGRPSVFARELIVAEKPRRHLLRRLQIGVLSAAAVAVFMIGYTLLLRGSPLVWESLVMPITMAMMIGGLVPMIRGPVRDSSSALPILLYFAIAVPMVFVMRAVLQQLDPTASVVIPGVKWLGGAMMIAGGVAAWFVRRPLRFRDDSPVASTFWGKVRKV